MFADHESTIWHERAVLWFEVEIEASKSRLLYHMEHIADLLLILSCVLPDSQVEAICADI